MGGRQEEHGSLANGGIDHGYAWVGGLLPGEVDNHEGTWAGLWGSPAMFSWLADPVNRPGAGADSVPTHWWVLGQFSLNTVPSSAEGGTSNDSGLSSKGGACNRLNMG